MICKKILQQKIISPILHDLNLFDKDGLELLTAIPAHESKGGKYLRQIGCTGDTGAFGLYGMEINTANEIYRYLHRKAKTSSLHKEWLEGLISHEDNDTSFADNLMHNHFYTTILCRLFFVRFPEPLPPHDNIEAIAKYWKKYYNTEAGEGTVEGFIKDYEWYMNEQ